MPVSPVIISCNKVTSSVLIVLDAIRILSGSVQWCLDLMSWLIDCLLHPEDDTIFQALTDGSPIDLDDLNTRLHASNNIALHLLLSSVSRGFLTAICRRLSHLDYTARKAMSTNAQSQASADSKTSGPVPPISPDLRNAYTYAATITTGSTVQIRYFEAFLTSISSAVKESYTSAGLPSAPQPQQQQNQQQQNRPPTDTGRNAVEQAMLFGGPLPAALKPAMSQLFTSLLPTLRANIDPSQLFFHNFSLLSLDPFPKSTLSNHTAPISKAVRDRAVAHTVDIFKRVPVLLGHDAGVAVEHGASTGGLAGLTALGAAAAASVVAGSGRGANERKWRRCTRCAAVMEDVSSQKPAVVFLIMQQRRCFCGGYWVIMTGDTIVI
jgi:mediator of RNA polymerase II transcription subunit 16